MMTENNPDWTAIQHGAVTSFYYDVLSGWEQWYFNVSDCHYDSIYCNREIMQEQFDEAVRRNARINIYGDWFDAMQGRFDPRRSLAELRPEYRRDDYYDFVVTDSANWLAPYAQNIDIMADGNHELAVLKAANTNLMDRLVDRLRVNNKYCSTIHGGYGGWIRYMFNLSNGENTGPRYSIRVKYFHGSSKNPDAPVTRGVIQTNRQAVFLPDANIVINGHSHESYYIPIMRERLNTKGQLFFDTQHHLRVPGYKQSYGDGTNGWDVTGGKPPKPIGGIWTRYFWDHYQTIGVQVIPDIRNPQPVSVNTNNLYDGKIYSEDSEDE